MSQNQQIPDAKSQIYKLRRAVVELMVVLILYMVALYGMVFTEVMTNFLYGPVFPLIWIGCLALNAFRHQLGYSGWIWRVVFSVLWFMGHAYVIVIHPCSFDDPRICF